MFYKIIRAILRPIILLLFWPKIKGIENFPTEGKVIIYSNHTSMLDPVVIGTMLPRKVHFMAKEELFRNPILSRIVSNLGAFPVKRETADFGAIKNSLRILKEGGVFGIFPEGTRQKEGEVQNFSHGMASIAHRSKAKIIPIGIEGQYKLFRRLRIRIGEELDMKPYFDQRSNAQLLELMSIDMKEALENLLKA